ncbi:hypothetical protein INT45_006790 [Circinella minor]|uniref:Uncharacterized protein n=1 Tax=Circinella minor TaxID=1195481 RepID=A0A8H7RSK4_9FUNG|nr:hypothetical protein INT45_006790 [Circinella minor]
MSHQINAPQQVPTNSHFSINVTESLENVSTPSVSVSATSSGSLEKDFEEFVSAMTLKYGITKKAVVERCGCKTAMFWKSCHGHNRWNQFVSETVKDDNDRTGEMESSGDSNDNGNSNRSINFPDMDAISANWKALSEEEKQLYAINFLSRRCGIDSFVVFGSEMAFNPLQQTTRIGTKCGFAFLQLLDQPETAQNGGNEFLRRMRQGQGLHQKFKFFLQASGSGLITSSGSTPSAPMAMRVGSDGNNTPYRSSAIPRYNPDNGKALPPHRRTDTMKISWTELAEDQDEDVRLCGWLVGVPVKDPSGNRKKGLKPYTPSEMDLILKALARKDIRFEHKRDL